MRLWTVHPRFLDAKGLVALWREALLAKAVLEGKTKGYRNHPQLVRFRAHQQPVAAVCEYLRCVLAEAVQRGYSFDATKIPAQPVPVAPIAETSGQLDYEWQHLCAKLAARDPARLESCRAIDRPDPHPLFYLVPGEIRAWEVVTKPGARA
ncbi:MAG: pyrimidine dimer DNA glycosylase/endonuclease V [Burkholderiaceae bacterium]|nr:pyrimidine dimer DNA glycosylase/endonuclease V [Burkholderiaceae bacterium]